MKILHLLAMNSLSGAENVAITIMESCPEYDMVYSSPDGPIRAIIENRGLQFHKLDTLSYFSIKHVIKDVNPDLIHAHDPHMSCLAALAAPSRIRIVSHLHNNPTWIQGQNFNTLAYHFCAQRFSKIIVVSDCIPQEFWKATRLRKKWVQLPNCLNIAHIQKLGQETPEQTADIVFVGRLTEQKNPLRLLQVLRELKVSGCQVSAAIIGDGELRQACEEMVAEYEMEQEIRFCGFLDNPYSWISHAKVLVLPSKWEGFGLVAVESLCLGVPVVCSGVGGLSQIVSNECGAICHTDEDYVREIKMLITDKNVWKRKHTNAIEKSKQFADLKHYHDQLHSIYSDK